MRIEYSIVNKVLCIYCHAVEFSIRTKTNKNENKIPIKNNTVTDFRSFLNFSNPACLKSTPQRIENEKTLPMIIESETNFPVLQIP